jgi:uncharacterized protein involved in outer membrane biogenesis
LLRVLLWLIGIIAALLLGLALLVPVLLDEERLVAIVAGGLERQTGMELKVRGGASISLFPTIGIELADAALTAPGDDPSRLELRSLRVGVKFLPLLSKRVEIEELLVDGLVATLPAEPPAERPDTAGMSDAELDAFYRRRREAMAEARASVAEAAIAVPLALNARRLEITDSRLLRVDPESGDTVSVTIRRFEARGLNLAGEAVPLEGEFILAGDPPLAVALQGAVRLDASGDRLYLDDVQVELSGATREPAKLQTSGEVRLRSQVAELELQVSVAATRGEGTLRFAALESPQIDTELRLNLFDPAVLALAGPGAAAGGSETGRTTRTDSGERALPFDALRSIDSRARLHIDRALFGGHELSAIDARLRARDGEMRLEPVTARVHGGELQLAGTLDARYNTARITTRGSLRSLDIAAALAAAEVSPVLTGRADADWEVAGEGRTVEGLVRGLAGPIDIEAADAVLQGIGVERMLCEVVALANQERLQASFPATSAFEALRARVRLADGEARLSPLEARLPGVALRGEGRLTLLEQTFRATFLARLSAELEQLDPACRINQRYTAIDWPVVCKGELGGDPSEWCAVDAESILADLASGEIQRQIEKKAGRLFDKLLDR